MYMYLNTTLYKIVAKILVLPFTQNKLLSCWQFREFEILNKIRNAGNTGQCHIGNTA